VDGVVGAGLVGDGIGADAAADEFGENFGGVAEERNRARFAFTGVAGDAGEGIVEIGGLFIDVAGTQAEVDPALAAFDGEAARARERGGQWLCTAHAAKPGGEDPFAGEVAVVMLAAHFDKGFVSALDDALGADINPAPGGHLAVHHQPLAVECVKVLPVRPVRDEVGIGNQHARGVFVGGKHANGFAGLDEEGFIVFEAFQGFDNPVETLPIPSSTANAAIDDQ